MSKLADIEPDPEKDWSQTGTYKIAGHPGLSENQRRDVELDYATVDGIAEVTLKKCLPFYTLKRLGLDNAPDTRRPQDQHIALVNPAEVQGFLGQVAQ